MAAVQRVELGSYLSAMVWPLILYIQCPLYTCGQMYICVCRIVSMVTRDKCVCSYGYLIYTGTMLRANKVLTSLRLRDCGLSPGDLCVVLSAVGMNTTLTSLDLSYNKFDDQSIASLGK